MANPFTDLRDAVSAVVDTISGVKNQGTYNGEAASNWDKINTIVARDGTSCWQRVLRVIPRAENDLGNEDCTYVYIHLLIGATKIADRHTTGDNAEETAWDIYSSLKVADWNSLGITNIHEAPYLNQITIEHQTPNTTVLSLVVVFPTVLGDDYIPLSPGGPGWKDLITDNGDGTYTFNGGLIIDGNVSADNLSGNNTGDQTIFDGGNA